MIEKQRQDAQLGVGQSGYLAGRFAGDPTIDQSRNLGYRNVFQEHADGGLGVDDRFTGRGGQDYWLYREGNRRHSEKPGNPADIAPVIPSDTDPDHRA